MHHNKLGFIISFLCNSVPQLDCRECHPISTFMIGLSFLIFNNLAGGLNLFCVRRFTTFFSRDVSKNVFLWKKEWFGDVDGFGTGEKKINKFHLVL